MSITAEKLSKTGARGKVIDSIIRELPEGTTDASHVKHPDLGEFLPVR